MKRLTLLITLFNFYSIIAMDRPPLVKDPNTPDQHGKIPLHNTIIAFYQSDTGAQEKTAEYIQLNKQYRQLQREITAEQAKNRTNNSALVILDAKYQTVQQKAKIIKAEHASLKQQADQHKKTAIQLVESGAYVNVPNLNHKTALMWDIVYQPLWKAIENGDVVTIEKYLHLGADPNFIEVEADQTALHFSIECNKPEAAQILLLGGAKSTTYASFAHGKVTVLHSAANKGTYKMVKTLLCSPQGSASVYRSTYNDKKINQEMFTFLCYVQQNKNVLPELPLEVRQNIYKFLLPPTTTLIDSVALQQLSRYKKFLGKNALINALTNRHMALLDKALTTNSLIEIGGVAFAYTPLQFPRLSFFNDLDLRKDAEAVHKALDPANLEQHRATITANYAKLLE